MMRDEHGSVVAETALVLPTLLLITTLLMGGLAALEVKAKCNQLASSVARAIQRDEPDWQEMAHQVWPDAEVRISTTDNFVTIIVSKKLMNMTVEGQAVAIQRV